MNARAGLVITLLASGGVAPAAQDATPKAPGREFAATAAAVVLDVVVRDGRGRPVHGLSAADFEVYEDGVRQTTESLQDLGLPAPNPSSAAPEARPAEPSKSVPPEEGVPAVLAFVFDQLRPEARASAHKAALAWLKDSARLDTAAGVFAIDASLRTVQPYTRDASLVRKALDGATSISASRFPAELQVAPSTQDLLDILVPRETAGVIPADSGKLPTAADVMGELPPLAGMGRAQRDMVLAMARATRRMEGFYETLAREQQGHLTINALLAMVASLRELPGRKSIVFFSEGLSLPPAVQGKFQSVLDAATRASVSVYAVDAAGLRVTSTLAESRGEIQSYTARKQETERGGSGIALRELEANEDALQRDPHAGLGALAEATGGLLIHGSNFDRGLRAIDEDVREHYVLAYTPTNQDYDGRFRRVEVKVPRRGLRVRTRRGYYALRAPSAEPVLPWEAPALATLDQEPRPRAFAVRSGGLSFPDPSGGPRRVPVLVSVPARGLAWRVDGGRYRADFAIVARVKDLAGAVVRKVGQPYELAGPADQLEAVRGSEVLFYRETQLPAGRYRLEAAVYDGLTRKATVSESELVVPADAAGATRASSLVVVKAAERVGAGREAAGALTVNNLMLYPALEEPLPRARALLSFFASVCVPAGQGAPPAAVELWADERLVDRADVELPAPDAQGCLRHLAGLPMGGLAAGGYELRLRLGTGAGEVVRSARLTLAE
jgi:VWFA-related protein